MMGVAAIKKTLTFSFCACCTLGNFFYHHLFSGDIINDRLLFLQVIPLSLMLSSAILGDLTHIFLLHPIIYTHLDKKACCLV